MIERYNEEAGKVEKIEDGAPTIMVPVYFNGILNGDKVEATILTRDVNPCYDKIIKPTKESWEIYPNTTGWMYDGRSATIDGVAYRVFDRCETADVSDALSR